MKTQQIKQKQRLEKKREKSHINWVREKYAHNQATILTATGMSILEYRLLFLECGCAFLEQFYDRSNAKQAEWYEKLAKNENYGFWKWYWNEWKLAESDFLAVFPHDVSIDLYYKFIDRLSDDSVINKGIKNYLAKTDVEI
ncbi:MAG: hypothetical protein RQ875_09465 [Vicingaceae bacterium]|nr:hypothetical protein [Vicingaceae bacterium]